MIWFPSFDYDHTQWRLFQKYIKQTKIENYVAIIRQPLTIIHKARCVKLFVGGFMSYLRYLYLLVYRGVQHLLCCLFLRLMYPMLPVSLDCPFLIGPSVFSNVYSWSKYFLMNTRTNTYVLCVKCFAIKGRFCIAIW